MYYELAGVSVRLLGTMHRYPPDAGESPTWATNVLSWAQTLVTEVDLREAQPMIAAFTRPQGTRLV